MERPNTKQSHALAFCLLILGLFPEADAQEWHQAGRVDIDAGTLAAAEIDGRSALVLRELPAADKFHFDEGFPEDVREDLLFLLEELRENPDCDGGWPLWDDPDCGFRDNLEFGELLIEIPATPDSDAPLRWALLLPHVVGASAAAAAASSRSSESLLIIAQSDACAGKPISDPPEKAGGRDLGDLAKRFALPAPEELAAVRFLLRCDGDAGPADPGDRRALEEAVVEIFNIAREVGFLPAASDLGALAGRLQTRLNRELLMPLQGLEAPRVGRPLATPGDWRIEARGLWRVADVDVEIEIDDATQARQLRKARKARKRIRRQYRPQATLRDRVPLAKLAGKDQQLLEDTEQVESFRRWERRGDTLVAVVRRTAR